MHNVKRVDQLRAPLASEKSIALELLERFKQQPFKDKVSRHISNIEEIGSMFLGANLENEVPENVEALSLSSTENMIQLMVVAPRKDLEEKLEKWGETVTLVG
jgi:hypothetical protein